MVEKGISNAVFGVVVAILVIIAAAGFVLYATKPTITQQTTVTSPPTTVFSTIVSTTVSTTTKPMPINFSGAFYNGKVITFVYTSNFLCTPDATKFFPNAQNQSKYSMGCEVGAGNVSAFPSGSLPIFVLVPAFAGLSIFGVQQLGATPQGFPTFTYNNVTYTILTHCGASLSQSACNDHMTLIYSPAFDVVERYLGITNGVFGLPQGVLPTPAHSHLIATSTKGQSVPWYLVIVLVFDPNIFPNPLTGQCRAIVPSNLTNPTANCLNNIQALENAMMTYSSAVGAANAKNPIWNALGKPGLQVVVPGISSPSALFSATNSNMVLFFSTPEVYPYPEPALS